MRCAVVSFPGSNCDHDVYHVAKHVLGAETTFLWHQKTSLDDVDLVVLPGGFSYGDYLRAGAMAARSPVMEAVERHAAAGGLVLGVCNGFQVLTEVGLLPGALRRNQALRFLCRDVYLRVERNDLPFTHLYDEGEVIMVPIAHAEGNYEDTPERLDALEEAGRVVFRYVTPDGEPAGDDPRWNPNGSARGIAGVTNEAGNVLGMMPHPERVSEAILGGGTDGLRVFTGVKQWLEARGAVRTEVAS